MSEDATEVIRCFLGQEFPNHASAIAEMSPDHSLIELGILDSLSLLMLVMFIETKWNIKVPPKDFVPDQFDTIYRISRFIDDRRSPAAKVKGST